MDDDGFNMDTIQLDWNPIPIPNPIPVEEEAA